MARLLERLLLGVNDKGNTFVRLWQKNCEIAEANDADLQSQITDLAAAQADIATLQADMLTRITEIEAAQAAADAAQADADTAQTTANTAARDDAISSSWTSPGNILSAADVGADATITVAAHSRKYGDASSVSVNGGTVTGLSFSTTYYVYYDQTSRAGGAVTYAATTNPNTALPNAAAGRHYCGEILTPADGAGGTSGGVSPPGGGGGIDPTDIP